MPDNNTEAENKLRKLGQRVREGFAKENPIPERSIETTRTAIHEEWERSRVTKSHEPTGPRPAQERSHEPEGLD